MQKLLVRACSGLVYIGLLISAIYLGWNTVFTIGALFLTLAIPELLRLLDLKEYKVAAYLSAFVLYILMNNPYVGDSRILLGLMPFLLLFLLTKNHENLVADICKFCLLLLYIVLPLSLLPLLYQELVTLQSPMLLLGVLACIWMNDTFAYLTGSLIGKNKLWAAVSPGKSWEGFIGGFIMSLLFGYILSQLFDSITIIQGILLGALISVMATFGDLFESSLKRRAGVKDSGNIMPGHGGILDRIDSILFVVPAVFTFFILLQLN